MTIARICFYQGTRRWKQNVRENLCVILQPTDYDLSPVQKLDNISRWLTALDCTEKHNVTLRLRQENTCMWFPNMNAYQEWRFGDNLSCGCMAKVGYLILGG